MKTLTLIISNLLIGLKRPGHNIIPTVYAVLLGMAAASQLNAQNYGIHFLGNTSDNVTGTAGVVPIAHWNNIAPGSSVSAITASDGSTTATLNFSGGQVNNAWNSGLTGDGANFSLMDGFWDGGNYGGATATATISGLPVGQQFNVYLYTLSDSARPANSGDKLPNYSVNGATYYAPVRGFNNSTYTTATYFGANPSGGFVQAITFNANTGSQIAQANFGNYIVISNVAPIGGIIAVNPEADGSSYRSPINGIEIVPNDSSSSFGVHFLGNTTDPVTGTAGVVPIANWNNIPAGPSSSSITGSDGSTTATFNFAGSQANNAWSSGVTGDGANLSLVDGFWDAGNYGGASATASIGGLTASSYTVYLYCQPDIAKPGWVGQRLPNYNVNGTTYYAALLGISGNGTTAWTTMGTVGGHWFDGGFKQATTTMVNDNHPVTPTSFGNYILIPNVTPLNGAINVNPEADGSTYRSPVNGIEIVPTDSSASFGVHFLGNTSDPVTGTAGVVPMANWNNISPAATSSTITGSDGSTTASFDFAGGQVGNGWNSGVTGDGANQSLMDGNWDAGNYGGSSATATIGGLTASSYNVYIYCLPDSARPANQYDKRRITT